MDSNAWTAWLNVLENTLKDKGYRKYNQSHKKEDFAYWKTIRNKKGQKIYQIGILFYDFRKYADNERIGLLFECMLIGGDRIDLSVSKDISIDTFENMCKKFYSYMKSFNKKKKDNKFELNLDI